MNRVNLRSIEYKLLFSPVCLYVIKSNEKEDKFNQNEFLFISYRIQTQMKINDT